MVREGKFRGNADYWRLCQTERYKENKKKNIYTQKEKERGRERRKRLNGEKLINEKGVLSGTNLFVGVLIATDIDISFLLPLVAVLFADLLSVFASVKVIKRFN